MYNCFQGGGGGSTDLLLGSPDRVIQSDGSDLPTNLLEAASGIEIERHAQ